MGDNSSEFARTARAGDRTRLLCVWPPPAGRRNVVGRAGERTITRDDANANATCSLQATHSSAPSRARRRSLATAQGDSFVESCVQVRTLTTGLRNTKCAHGQDAQTTNSRKMILPRASRTSAGRPQCSCSLTSNIEHSSQGGGESSSLTSRVARLVFV